MNPPSPQFQRKAGWLIGAILLTVSVSGFFMGLRQTGSQISMTRPVSLVTPESERGAILESNLVPVAVSYAEQDWLRDGANGQWQNLFVSVTPPLKGSRAWPLAPPTIPHSTLMRSDCLSCHGPRGLFGLRTPHPDRQSCVQCHASDAALDQHIFSSTAK